MVTILVNFNTKYDNLDLDELLTIKQAMASFYQKNFQKAIHIEFQFFIENSSEKNENAPSD